jgi:hypothetical protein
MMLSIEQITPQLTWRLRREVLYPNEQLAHMAMDEDNHGYHFGAFPITRWWLLYRCFKRARLAVPQVCGNRCLAGQRVGTQLLRLYNGVCSKRKWRPALVQRAVIGHWFLQQVRL